MNYQTRFVVRCAHHDIELASYDSAAKAYKAACAHHQLTGHKPWITEEAGLPITV